MTLPVPDNLAARSVWRAEVFKKIAVGVDYTPLSDRAIGVALDLARATRASVVLVHVRPMGAELRSAVVPNPSARVAIEQRLAEEAAGYAHGTGLTVEHGVVDGDAADELVRFAELWNCDLLVLGSAGRTGVKQLVVGSVAAGVVQRAGVPVLLVGPNLKA